MDDLRCIKFTKFKPVLFVESILISFILSFAFAICVLVVIFSANMFNIWLFQRLANFILKPSTNVDKYNENEPFIPK